jgi:hypothetical protein
MLRENYGPGDWTNGEIESAKALWDEHNTRRSSQRPSILSMWLYGCGLYRRM